MCGNSWRILAKYICHMQADYIRLVQVLYIYSIINYYARTRRALIFSYDRVFVTFEPLCSTPRFHVYTRASVTRALTEKALPYVVLRAAEIICALSVRRGETPHHRTQHTVVFFLRLLISFSVRSFTTCCRRNPLLLVDGFFSLECART